MLTHSPYMINPMRPEQVRLLRRNIVDGKPTSSNVRQATDSNFLQLRTSLGISASDSLLFAPVTVVIEGDTEFKCLAPLIKKLADAKVEKALKIRQSFFLCLTSWTAWVTTTNFCVVSQSHKGLALFCFLMETNEKRLNNKK